MAPINGVDTASLPWPGDELAFRVAGGTDREHFYRSGMQSVEDINAMLALAGKSMGDHQQLLDFGCGCGRIMLWLADLAPGRELHGVDIDERAIAWAQENLPFATFKANQPLPPLDYPDGTFDLVFNHSVFTHIDEDYQDQWLAELRRVTRPGGHLVLSVHGDKAFQAYEGGMRALGVDPEEIRATLESRGIAHVKQDNFVGGPFPDFYHSTFHAPWYVHEHWGQYFSVVGYAAGRSLGFQDFVLLERTADPRPRRRLRAPAAAAAPAAEGVTPAMSAIEEWARTSPLAEPARRLVRRARAASGEGQAPDAAPAGTDGRLWEALRLQGERVNRLEADLWEAIRQIRTPGE